MRILITVGMILLPLVAGAKPPTADVNVVNEPSVQIANTPDVVIRNAPANAVPVQEVGAKDYVHIHDVTLIPVGDDGFGIFGFGKTIYTVPAGKRLIVETVSPFVSDIKGVNFDVNLRPNDSAGGLNFALQTKGVYRAGSIPEKGRDSTTVSAKLVVNPEVDLVYQMIRDVATSPEVAGTSITVVGYLEDAP
jgi:hypothetical protein